ncbi:MAG: hypothetical protein Q8M15_02930 [Bacteroidota bacterium]|nr:hypothetical protein [Bacteroidota bacterium]
MKNLLLLILCIFTFYGNAQKLTFSDPSKIELPFSHYAFQNNSIGYYTYEKNNKYHTGDLYIIAIPAGSQTVSNQFHYIKKEIENVSFIIDKYSVTFIKNNKIYNFITPWIQQSNVRTLGISIYDFNFKKIEEKKLFDDNNNGEIIIHKKSKKTEEDKKIDCAINSDTSLFAMRYGKEIRVFETDNFKLVNTITLSSASEGEALVFTVQNDLVLLSEKKCWFIKHNAKLVEEIQLDLPLGVYFGLKLVPSINRNRVFVHVYHNDREKDPPSNSVKFIGMHDGFGHSVFGFTFGIIDIEKKTVTFTKNYFKEGALYEVEFLDILERSEGKCVVVADQLNSSGGKETATVKYRRQRLLLLDMEGSALKQQFTYEMHAGDIFTGDGNYDITALGSNLFFKMKDDNLVLLYNEYHDRVLHKVVFDFNSLTVKNEETFNTFKDYHLIFDLSGGIITGKNKYMFRGCNHKNNEMRMMTLELD